MKIYVIKFSIIVSILFLGACKTEKTNAKEGDSPTEESFYLGQKPPGLIPEVFAPGIVSTEDIELTPLFDPLIQEFYFLRKIKGESSKTYVIQFRNGEWQKPVLKENMLDHGMKSFISNDGKTRYLGNEFQERTAFGWSEKISLGPAYDKIPIMRLTSSDLGTYVFDERDPDGIGKIRYSVVKDGVREKPKVFGKEINSGKWNAHPFIAPDESYLIWDSEREGGYGGSDLYISFRQEDGSWGSAINMGSEINTKYEDNRGMVSHEGKYFFYNTLNIGETFEESEANIFWVDAQIIEHLKRENDSQNTISSYFGQKPPGLIPEVFAPGIVRNASNISFSPDLDEVYFSAHKKDEETSSIYFSKLEDNKWTPVKRANFTNGKKNEELYPSVSLNDKRIYFTAFDSIFSDEKIWYVNRLEDSWSDAIQLDSPINNDTTFYINQSKSGDLFYTSISKGKIYRAPNKNGEFPQVEEVEIDFGHHGFISPSQEYLLVYTRNKENEKRKDHDIYVCFKEKDGTWTKPINLGDTVNSNDNEGTPSVTPDGKYMFFGRSEEGEDGNIYWVSTEVIHKLKPADLSASESPYFGQKPPGLIPEVFAPGIVSIDGRFEGTVSFSPDFDEMYFAADSENQETSIYFSKLEGNNWTSIKRADFTNGKKKEEMHPFVSPDGKRIYFTAMDTAFTDEKIWYVNRLGDSWSDALLLDSPINNDLVFFPNQAKNGDLYYFNLSKFKTYYAPNKNGKFPEVQEVALEFGHHAFISPSQDYLIVTERNNTEEGSKDNDMYVYFIQKDGTWTKPINLGNTINTSFNEKGPRITPDGKYLFFGRDERDIEPGLANIYWVSTEVIEKLRLKQ